nr:long chain acyl-CoA synthetase 8-like [Quercus suber]
MGKTFMIRNFETATEGSKAPLKVIVMENQLTIQHDCYCVALVVPSHQVLEKWAQQAGINYRDFSELCDKAETVSEVQQSLSKAAKTAKLDKFETPAKIKLLPEAWTPESGLVTAALKIKREQLKAKFKDELQKLYG